MRTNVNHRFLLLLSSSTDIFLPCTQIIHERERDKKGYYLFLYLLRLNLHMHRLGSRKLIIPLLTSDTVLEKRKKTHRIYSSSLLVHYPSHPSTKAQGQDNHIDSRKPSRSPTHPPSSKTPLQKKRSPWRWSRSMQSIRTESHSSVAPLPRRSSLFGYRPQGQTSLPKPSQLNPKEKWRTSYGHDVHA